MHELSVSVKSTAKNVMMRELRNDWVKPPCSHAFTKLSSVKPPKLK